MISVLGPSGDVSFFLRGSARQATVGQLVRAVHWGVVHISMVLDVRVSSYICIYTYIDAHAYAHLFVIRVYVYQYVHLDLYLYLHSYLCRNTYTYVYVYLYIYMHVYIHIHINIYTHTHTYIHRCMRIYTWYTRLYGVGQGM